MYILQAFVNGAWVDQHDDARLYGHINHYEAPRGTTTRLRRA